MEAPLADRVLTAEQSDIRRYSAICASMGGINLSQGVCDQPCPPELKAAASTAIEADQAVYTNLCGIKELRDAIAGKLRRFNGIDVDPDTQVVVSAGSAGAFACAVMATLNPGDECLIFFPFYSYHVRLLEAVGAVPKFVRLSPPDWSFDLAELEASIGPRTRMILVNTPANPSGKVFTENELDSIVRLAERHSLWIATDEIYEYITFDRPHISPGHLPGAADRTITISGASKTYAVTGWRIGYAAAPARVAGKMAVMNDLFYICAPAPLQHGVLAGLGLADDYYEQMRRDYHAKRDLLVATLREIGFHPFVPQGSYYIMAEFGDRYPDATAAAESILQNLGVATVPGSAFYPDPAEGRTQLRFCFAKKRADLEEACRRLGQLGNHSG